MRFLELFKAPQLEPPAVTVIRRPPVKKRAIEASETTRLNAGWKAANLSADEEMRRAIERTRARSRDLAYNNEYARKFLAMVGTHVVGPQGFALQSLAASGRDPDKLARDAIELAFWRWARPGACEATGRMSFAELQRTLIETVARDGEALVLRRRGAANPWGYDLKLIEIDRLPVSKNETLKGGHRIVMGIEINADGRAVAYWLNLGEQLDSALPTALTRVPSSDILHLYRAQRPEQHRALPWMHPVMTGLKMLAGYEEAAIVAARVGAAKMGFYTSPDGAAEPLADDQTADGEFLQDADAGAFTVLPPGYRFESWNPDYPHQTYADFIKARLRSIAAGLNIAYHTLANDLSDVNYSSARAGTLEERDHWMTLQGWFADAFLRPVFLDWLESALARGAITLPNGASLPPEKLDKFAEHAWQGRRWSWVDPLKDIEAARLAIKSGITSPQIVAAQNGVDIEDVLAQTAAFEAMTAGMALIDYGIPPAVTQSAPSTPSAG